MKDEITRMAREAGATNVDAADPQCWVGAIAFETDELERFAALVATAERNAILQMSRDQWFKTQADFEEAIRAREST